MTGRDASSSGGSSHAFLGAHLRVADAHWERSDCKHTIGGVPVPSVSCGDQARAMNHSAVARVLNAALRRVRARHGHALRVVYLATNMDCGDARVGYIQSELWHRSGARLACDQVALLERVTHDNFVASLIEQELCARALAFVGSKYSTWTDTVRGMRADRCATASSSDSLTFSFEELWSEGLG